MKKIIYSNKNTCSANPCTEKSRLNLNKPSKISPAMNHHWSLFLIRFIRHRNKIQKSRRRSWNAVIWPLVKMKMSYFSHLILLKKTLLANTKSTHILTPAFSSKNVQRLIPSSSTHPLPSIFNPPTSNVSPKAGQ